MELKDGVMSLSATDLVGHHDCHHLSMLERGVALGLSERPRAWSPLGALLAERGEAHERAFIQYLADKGLEIARVEGKGIGSEAVSQTLRLMQAGVRVIVQGALTNGRWGGRLDVLRRVDGPSQLGAWSYEAIDTKLARLTKGNTLLQLGLYSDLIETAQGIAPEKMHVVTPWSNFELESYRVDDFAAYVRLIKARLLSVVDNPISTYPEPNPHCDFCRWRSPCEERRRSDDHLCFVAGISKLQINELRTRDVTTTAALAAVPLPLSWKPSRGAVEPYERVREQARLQVQARTKGQPIFELLPREPGFGLARLPQPSPGDIFFDVEGDPFVDLGGREYLFGYLFLDGEGQEIYRADWALTRSDERRAFESFIDFVMDRWARFPDLHIYHFAPYEPSALRRLMGRYASREDEIDRLLRAKVFVDLYPIVRRGIRASVESYSIKNLEEFCGFERAVSLEDANQHLAVIQSSLEAGGAPNIPADSLTAVAGYNRDDCASASALRHWLEELRESLIKNGEDIRRPPPESGDPSETISARQARVRELMDRLLSDIPIDEEQRDPRQQAIWILAHILDWHRREEKVGWWEYFRLCELDSDELLDEQAALSGLAFLDRIGGTAKAPIDRYSFPPQETTIRGGEDLRVIGGDRFGKVDAISFEDGTIDIKKRGATADLHPVAVFAHSRIPNDELSEALLRIGAHVADHGIEGEGPYLAARDLLLHHPPRINGVPIQVVGETPLDAARRIARSLDGGVFPIQGPPGSGKTFVGARMICELVRCGRKVGITATSHKVVRLLLEEVIAAARQEGLELSCVQKVRPDDQVPNAIIGVTDNQGVYDALADGAQVAGGTAWLWAPPQSFDSVDVLFVDEAAQMSLANVLAVSQAARCLVLLGDPNQLEQPQQGTHPDGTEVSALDHILAGAQTIQPDQGLFMGETWRLHPEICSFVSEQFYEGRLQPRPDLDRQAIQGDEILEGSGLRFVAVDHDGNQSSSIEEVDCVDRLVRSLLQGNPWWRDKNGDRARLGLNDILIIAPYNAQVFELKQRLPEDARVGTVDKFQGQEAPLVIYSMTTSDSEHAPHGMEFLYSRNRLNVAVSRAKCMCVVVASPRIFEPVCRSPRQMELANAYCRYLEVAQPVSI